MPDPVNAQSNAVYSTPENKRPASAMPEPTDQECDHNIDVSCNLALSASTQWDINVISQETTECDVPASPEILNIDG